jgi:hypothetical protein
MMKWWWRYQCETKQPEVERPHPKGFWLECLTAENFDPQQTAWADHFIAVLENVKRKYAEPTEVPKLCDPGLPSETIKTSMTLAEFKTFIGIVEECLEQAQQANEEPDDVESSRLWRVLFGPEFPHYDKEETKETQKMARSNALGDIAHAQKPNWPMSINKRYKVRIDAYLYKETQRLSGLNSNGRYVQNGLRIKYVASTNVKGSYDVWWQVVNTGEHARKENGLRGGFFKARGYDFKQPSSNPLVNWEYSAYTGKHWIECFIVKDGVCVARSGRFYISIKNPNYP